ncbi:hypothetical protein LX66_2929 [Chitinophaga japonensis]|uniref:Ketosteroid isomerase-like protein n=2 Tax=Chitinophaga japonensis TaxID=104662 RepID=A0A562T5R6_CHIJA|nr:hypothetical protein LX66_2929 [Chitinophaga japonensis]
MQRSFLFLLVLLPAVWACNTPVTPDREDARQAVLRADTAFSGLSQAKGFRYAFLAYADSTTVLLRDHHYPIIGREALQFIEHMNDSGVTLTWEPSFAAVAASADLGYTYGTYTFAARDTTIRGTYVTIWKKDGAGNWRFVLDTGNEGLGK